MNPRCRWFLLLLLLRLFVGERQNKSKAGRRPVQNTAGPLFCVQVLKRIRDHIEFKQAWGQLFTKYNDAAHILQDGLPRIYPEPD